MIKNKHLMIKKQIMIIILLCFFLQGISSSSPANTSVNSIHSGTINTAVMNVLVHNDRPVLGKRKREMLHKCTFYVRKSSINSAYAPFFAFIHTSSFRAYTREIADIFIPPRTKA